MEFREGDFRRGYLNFYRAQIELIKKKNFFIRFLTEKCCFLLKEENENYVTEGEAVKKANFA